MGTGFKVWFLASFLSACYTTIVSVLAGRYLEVFWSILVFFIACVVLLPMLVVFIELLKSGKGKPYAPPARLALLTFWSGGFLLLLFALVNLVFSGKFGLKGEMAALAGTTIAGFVTAVLLCRRSLQNITLPPDPPPPMPRNFQGSVEDLPSAKIRIR